jgi:hypothetical protein
MQMKTAAFACFRLKSPQKRRFLGGAATFLREVCESP